MHATTHSELLGLAREVQLTALTFSNCNNDVINNPVVGAANLEL